MTHFDDSEDFYADDIPRLGKCCICEREGASVRNIVTLPQRSPEPGIGCWGCFQCDLPMAGAVSVLCDECMDRTHGAGIKYACLGAPSENRRIPIEQLSAAPFDHDMSRHPGESDSYDPSFADAEDCE